MVSAYLVGHVGDLVHDAEQLGLDLGVRGAAIDVDQHRDGGIDEGLERLAQIGRHSKDRLRSRVLAEGRQVIQLTWRLYGGRHSISMRSSAHCAGGGGSWIGVRLTSA